MCGLLLGPRVASIDQVKYCVVNVDLPGPFGVSLNCDSSEFMRLAVNPSRLLDVNNIRTSRPTMILVAASIASIISPLVPKPTDMATVDAGSTDDANRTASSLETMGAAYVAYVLLNFAILCGAFLLMRNVMMEVSANNPRVQLSTTRTTMTIVGFGLLMISNDAVKAFAWSPHLQLFNILVPVLCIWTLWMSWTNRLVERWQAFLFALGIGLGVAAYPTFLMCLFCMLGPWIVRQWQAGGFHDKRTHLYLRTTALVGTALSPLIVWYFYVKITVGNFYIHETTKFNQVVWIADAWRDGPFTLLYSWFGNAFYLVVMATPQLLFTALAVVWTFIMLARDKTAILTILSTCRLALSFCGVAAVLYIAFFATVGYMAPRLAVGIVPACVVAAGIFAVVATHSISNRNCKILEMGYVGLGALAAMVTVVKDGPWS
jgi:hypothetical protein